MHPEIPVEGITLEELFRDRYVDVQSLKARLQQVAQDEGLPFGNRSMTYNTRLAQETAKWAESQGLGEAFHMAVFRAYFADGTNIGDVSELVRLAVSVGLPAAQAEKITRSRSYGESVEKDWSRAGQLGIMAVPTFVLGGQTMVGAQAYPVLKEFVKRNGIRPRLELVSQS